MKKTLKISTIILFILTISNFSAVCYADNAGHKLVRGVSNILTGWLEIPMSIYETSVDENPFVGITVGLAKGVGMTIA
ncbi:exosortase system-associated protein, TIGR04073 family, partial [bacterium]|nr:exosortase system-associated protein, TIGR04073 family [bacterium]